MQLDFALNHAFGVVRTATLLRCGMSTADIRRAVKEGTLTCPRRGWYAASGALPPVVSAVRAGGVLSCVSALALHGYWVPERPESHIRLTEHAKHRTAGLPSGKQLRLCGFGPVNRRPSLAVDPALVALAVAPGCVSAEELVATMDSMLHQERVSLDSLREALQAHPRVVRDLVDECDGAAESGTESLVRLRLRRRNIKVRTQVRIEGVGRVDLLVGNRLVIEVDSRAHHTGELAYESDRRRDRLLIERGYLVIRVSYHQVMHEWADIEKSVLAVVRRREHRKPC